MKKWGKIIHWLIFLVFLVLVMSAFSANFFFSKKEIIKSFSYSFDALSLDIGLSDKIFIARVERRFTWAVHFWFGVIFYILFILKLFFKENLKLNLYFFSLATILFISGFILYIRIYITVDIQIQQIARWIHFIFAWIFSLSLMFHIFFIIKKEQIQRGVVSNMFYFKSILIAFLCSLFFNSFLKADLISLENNSTSLKMDKNFKLGVEYLKGKIGAKIIEKTIKNCPYARCDQLATFVNKNIKTIAVKKPDIKKAILYLKKSFIENKNPNAAFLLYLELKKRIDYRSKIVDDFFVQLGEKEVGMKYDDYFKLAKNALIFLKDRGDCKALFEYAEWFYKGYFNENKDIKKAYKYFQKALEVCPKNSLTYKMAKNRIKKIKIKSF